MCQTYRDLPQRNKYARRRNHGDDRVIARAVKQLAGEEVCRLVSILECPTNSSWSARAKDAEDQVIAKRAKATHPKLRLIPVFGEGMNR